KDGVGEMGVRVDWPRGHSEAVAPRSLTERGTRTCGVEVAEVHVKALYSVGPTREISQLALRTGAHHPTGVDIRMIEGLRQKDLLSVEGECARARYVYLAIGQPPGDIGENRPIPEQIASAHTRRAEPVYFCRVIEGVSPMHSVKKPGGWCHFENGETEI